MIENAVDVHCFSDAVDDMVKGGCSCALFYFDEEDASDGPSCEEEDREIPSDGEQDDQGEEGREIEDEGDDECSVRGG